MKEKNHNQRALAWVGLVSLLGGLFLMATWQPPHNQVLAAAYAQQGEVLAQFPKSLILDGDVAMEQGFSVAYSPSQNEYTANWGSENEPDVVLNDYQNYFLGDGWIISPSVNSDPSLDTLSAASSTGYAQVAITHDGDGSQVTVTFTVGQQ